MLRVVIFRLSSSQVILDIILYHQKNIQNTFLMNIFGFFRKASASASSPGEIVQKTISDENTLSSTASSSNSGEIISITYGTGMPIDVIYAFINENYEQEGYQDALINSDAEYCKAKEAIILHKLQQLFKRVLLRYRGEIRDLIVKINNAKSLFALQSASLLEARKETCEEHISEINDMIEKVKANSPEMMTMIESYRRGFTKGCAAQTANFLNHNQIPA